MVSELEELTILYRSKIKELETLKGLNDELLEVTHNLLTRTIQICKRNDIPIGFETKALLSEVRRALHNIHDPIKIQPSTENLQDKFNRQDDSTLIRNTFYIHFLPSLCES